MRKRTILTVLLVIAAFGAAYAQTTVQRSLYVSAQGDDNNNNGRSETTPYKTLMKAVEAANAGVIKTITILGTIYDTGIKIEQSGADEILITGKPDASEAEKAVISMGLEVGGKFRFTHIQLASITRTYRSATVTLGAGAVVTNGGRWGGVSGVATLIMTDDATITGCNNGGVSGCSDVNMSGNASITNNGGRGIDSYDVTMSGHAKVSGNKGTGVICNTLRMSGNAEISGNVNTSGNGDGGGAFVKGNSTISGNARIGGNTAKNGGGIYFDKRGATLTIEGGEISNNKAEYGAGVYIGNGTFTHKGGTVTGNTAEFVGGGVYVKSGATYTAGGGKVSINTAGDGGDDVFKQ